MFYKIVISLNMWFKRHGLCKSMKKKKIRTHEGPKVLKKIHEHMKAHKNKKNEMIAMSQNKKARERSLIQKEYSIDLEMFYPHTCTS